MFAHDGDKCKSLDTVVENERQVFVFICFWQIISQCEWIKAFQTKVEVSYVSLMF